MRSVAVADHVAICLDGKLLDLTPIAPGSHMFKVHQQLRKVNEKAYEPALLAIGPYNQRKDCLAFMEKQKLHYLQSMLERKKENSVQTYIVALRELEERARGCYAEYFSLDTDKFAEMMLLDGCFIVELFRKYAVQNLRDKCDPIFQTNWMLNGLVRDLLLFENQLPFFVLTKLFEMTKVPTETCGIIDLVLHFFRGLLHPWSRSFGRSSYDSFQNVDHLLSLIYRNVCSSWSVIIEVPGNEVRMENCTSMLCAKVPGNEVHMENCTSMLCAKVPGNEVHMENCTSMLCATKLQEAGVKFKNLEEANSLFDIKFNNGIMEIPQLEINDDTETFLRNLIAFEQYTPYQHLRVSDYVLFMDYLINSSKDVELLRRRGIIYNCLGDDDVVSTMFNKLGDYVTVPKILYAEIYSNVNKHCRKRRNIWMAKLRHDYFHSPWALLSFLAAVLLLLLSLAQTIFSILSYISQ